MGGAPPLKTWLLLAAILSAVALGWVAYRNLRAARAGAREAPGGPERQRGRDGRGRDGRRARALVSRRPVLDAEFSSETFVPPEVADLGPEPGPTEGGPAHPEGGPGWPRETGAPRPAWGRVAVPGWEFPLPWSYGETRLVLMTRDPYWLFAYWELTAEAHRAAAASVGPEAWFAARPVLRVYDVTSGAHYDVDVDEDARNFYLNVGRPDRSWYVEIGRLTPDGRFVMLARSNTVHTPRDGPSGVVDSRWPPLGQEPFWPQGLPGSPGMPGSAGMAGPVEATGSPGRRRTL